MNPTYSRTLNGSTNGTITSGNNLSSWFSPATPTIAFEKLSKDITTDILVIGGGIAGLTTAYCLAKAGRTVVLVEDGYIGSGETGRTTAHLTCALDDRYFALEKMFDENTAKLAADSHRAGIDVKIITGDYKETASAIAKMIGIQHFDRSITGVRVMEMTDVELRNEVRETTVFARMFPEAKLRVINALKANGDIVAMTGDGVNDGPALKAAHIGIAMGARGTEIAKQAASMVLLNDDIATMVNAVAMGRRIYANLKKAIQYIISIHIPIIAVVTVPLLLGWKFHDVFTPIHVIILELIMGPTCSIVFENEPMEPNVMQQPPRKATSTFFTFSELSLSIVQGCVIAVSVLGVLWLAIATNLRAETARMLVFSTLVFANIFLTLVNRSFTEPLTTTLRYRNNLIPLAFGITLLILLMSFYVPFVRALFQFTEPTPTQILLCVGIGAGSVLWIEVKKMIRRGSGVIDKPTPIPSNE
jgi:P-type Ca2+ transporter type 2C